jgi:hypothetical protein
VSAKLGDAMAAFVEAGFKAVEASREDRSFDGILTTVRIGEMVKEAGKLAFAIEYVHNRAVLDKKQATEVMKNSMLALLERLNTALGGTPEDMKDIAAKVRRDWEDV